MFKLHIEMWPYLLETAEQRRACVYRTFMQLAFYLLLALVQWLVMLIVPLSIAREIAKRHESTFVLVFFVSLLFFLLFSLSDQVREMSCMNWLVTLVIVEGHILAIGLLVLCTNLLRLCLGFLTVAVILILTSFVAILMPYDITQDENFVFLVSLCVFLLSIYAIVLYVILNLTWPFFLYAVVIVLLVLPVLVYHVQCVLGNGHVRTSLQDDKLAALLLFHDFLALFMLTIYWRPTRGDEQ